MLASLQVVQDLVIEALWSPVFCPEGNRHRLTKVVQLQTATSHCRHDGGVMDNLYLDLFLPSSQHEV